MSFSDDILKNVLPLWWITRSQLSDFQVAIGASSDESDEDRKENTTDPYQEIRSHI